MPEPINLLVVDDHVLFRRGIIGLVREQPDFNVAGEAGNSLDAVQLCIQTQPDVVLMDLEMPGGKSLEAVKTIREETNARVLMLTISGKDEDLMAALSAGANGYLLKSTEPEHLIQAIRLIAAGQAVLSPEITDKVMQAAASTRNHQSTATLSPREREVLIQLAKGATTAEIADILTISKNTAKTHIRRILNKLEASNRAEAVARAASLRLIPHKD